MAEPNLDIGLLYVGGITKPTVSDVGRVPIVALDPYDGAPNLAYVRGVERRVAYRTTSYSLNGVTTKVNLNLLYKIPANTFLGTSDNAESARLKVRIMGELPARVGTKIGVDFNATEVDAAPVAALPPAANPFIYECTVYAAATAIRTESTLLTSGQSPVVRTQGVTIDPSVEISVYITGQLANSADTLLFRRVEAWLL